MRFWEQASGSGGETKMTGGGTYQQLKMALNPSQSSSKKIQESAAAVLKNMTPLLQKCRAMSFKKMLMPAPQVNRASQQTELIKWQQDMFHRILNMRCLVEEDLIQQAELDQFRADLLRTVTVPHPDGEWADFTRDKLLFLQDLYQSKCISAEEYHSAKRPILSRLADQGAELDSHDFKFNSKDLLNSEKDIRSVDLNMSKVTEQQAEPEVAPDTPTQGSGKRTPIKQVMDAMARLKNTGSGGKSAPEEKPRVPHAMDFVRHDPRECPVREAPVFVKKPKDVPVDSPLYFDASTGSTRDLLHELSNDISNDVEAHRSPASVASSPTISSLLSPPSVSSAAQSEQTKCLLKPPRKLTFTPTKSSLTPTKSSKSNSLAVAKPERSISSKFSGIFGKWQGWQAGETQKPASDVEGDDDADSDDDKEKTSKKNTVWKKLDILRTTSWKQQQQTDDDDDFGKEVSDRDPLLKAIDNYPSDKINEGYIHGQGPNIKKLKKKVAVKSSPTNFFIDQVLGDNIKTELARIRAEMARTNPLEQAFTNDQIDAIATRLPVDKIELMRFFPKSWCDRYGDVVLEVVHREFKSHVSEMDGMRKATKEKKLAESKPHAEENDENRASAFQTTPKRPPRSMSANTTPQRSTPSKPVLTKCYTTDGAEKKSSSVHRQRDQPSPRATTGGRARRGLGFENDLDRKLEAEILRMPFKNFNEFATARAQQSC